MLLNTPFDKNQPITQPIARPPSQLSSCKLAKNQNTGPDKPKRRPEGLGKIIVLGAFQGPKQLLLSCRFLF
jgi:hypothetical protein